MIQQIRLGERYFLLMSNQYCIPVDSIKEINLDAALKFQDGSEALQGVKIIMVDGNFYAFWGERANELRRYLSKQAIT